MSNAKITYKLCRPIEAHGQEIHELELGEPTAEMVRKLGFPFSFNMSGKDVDFKADIVANYISELAVIPPSAVNKLHPFDLMNLGTAIMQLFMPPHQT